MSGAISATTAVAISAGVAAVGTAASVMASNKQARQQKAAAKEAAKEAQRNNEITQTKAREDMRRQNAKEADVSSIYEQNLDQNASGGSTLLTGPEGINNSDLTLGKGNKLGA